MVRAGWAAASMAAIPGLSIGRYSVAVEKPGFRRYTQTGISLAAGETLEVTFTDDDTSPGKVLAKADF